MKKQYMQPELVEVMLASHMAPLLTFSVDEPSGNLGDYEENTQEGLFFEDFDSFNDFDSFDDYSGFDVDE